MRSVAPLLLALGCGPAAIEGPAARYELAAREFYATPFPSAHRLRADGTAELIRFPNPGRVELVDQLVALASEVRGFGTSSGVFFALTASVSLRPQSLAESLGAGAMAFLARVDTLERIPIRVAFLGDGGPFGAPNLLALLPLQGAPLAPGARYMAVVRRGAAAPLLGVSLELRQILSGQRPEGMSEAAHASYAAAVAVLETSLDLDDVAALAVFDTQDPRAELGAFLARAAPPPRPPPPRFVEGHPGFCVYATELSMPSYQAGTPPFSREGGGWTEAKQRDERARLFLTVPRTAMPAAGFPLAVFVRTGGGGDRPLIDRGVRASRGGPAIEPGSGAARELAAVGFAGLMVDGPHGGLRNPSGADEQFLVYNFFNPTALRDNIRQSALELALLPPIIDALTVTATACAGAPSLVRFDGRHLALIGHSMGASIAPLVFFASERFGALVMSGAGGSLIENVIHKRSPLHVKPIAERILGYADDGRSLGPFDPVLSLMQWAGEAADPPVYARGLTRGHVLMFQGVVDTYILPPIAHALSLPFGLDLAGSILDDRLPPLLALGGRSPLAFPVEANAGGRTAVVVQHAEDGVEDGHEVMFQLEAPKRQYRCFLEGFAAGRPIVVDGASRGPCR